MLMQGVAELGTQLEDVRVELGAKMDAALRRLDLARKDLKEIKNLFPGLLEGMNMSAKQRIVAISYDSSKLRLKTFLGWHPRIVVVEERLTAQVQVVREGQDLLLQRVDEVLQAVERLNLLNRQNALSTKMTEFLRCGASVQHAFDTVQGLLRENDAFKYGFRSVLFNSTAATVNARASEWTVQAFKTPGC